MTKSKKPFNYLRYRVEIIDSKINNMNLTDPKVFKATITEKQIRQGKNGKDYLLLKLDNQEVICVFHGKDTPESI
jgi:hypothetical protein